MVADAIVVVAVVIVMVVVAVPTHKVDAATHLSLMVAELPSSHSASAQYASASHELIPGAPGKQFVLATDGVVVAVVVVIARAVVVVVVVRMPAQLELAPSHLSSVVVESPSSHSRPWQYSLTAHDSELGMAL